MTQPRPPAEPQLAQDDPALAALLGAFPASPLSRVRLFSVEAALVPQPYARLLVHRHHMTVTLEAYHGSRVALEVIDRSRRGSEYARSLVLRSETGQAVMLGLVQLHLDLLDETARAQVVQESVPLGRILIEKEILRWIQPRKYYRIPLDDELRRLFAAPAAAHETYGRSASIVCHNAPAVELFEVVAPEIVTP